MSRPAAVSAIWPSSPTWIKASRRRRLIAMVTAGADTRSQRTRVTALTVSPSLSASAMAFR
jgi:hypothetical protein